MTHFLYISSVLFVLRHTSYIDINNRFKKYWIGTIFVRIRMRLSKTSRIFSQEDKRIH
jgi:hypothetical protein